MLSKNKQNCQNKWPGCGGLPKDQHDFAVMSKVFTSNVQGFFFHNIMVLFIHEQQTVFFSQHYGTITVNLTWYKFEYFVVMAVPRFTDLYCLTNYGAQQHKSLLTANNFY